MTKQPQLFKFQAFLIALCVCINALPGLSQKRRSVDLVQTQNAQKVKNNAVLVKVETSELANLPDGKSIIAALARLPYVSREKIQNNDWHLRLKPNSAKTKIAIERQGVGVINTVLPAEVSEYVKREATWQAIKSLNNKNSNSKVKIELRIVAVEARIDGDTGAIIEIRDKKSNELSSGGNFRFEVKNVGSVPAYITIFDLDSLGRIQTIFPVRDVVSQDFLILPDKEWHPIGGNSAIYRLTPPFGLETFKVIATAAKTRLSEVFDDSLRRDSRNDDALTQYFARLPDSLEESKIALEDWATATLTLHLTESSFREQGTLHVLSVGVSNYQRKAGNKTAPDDPNSPRLWNLNTENDVREFSAILRENGQGIYDNVNVKLLYDKEATGQAITAAFREIIAQAKPQDTFVFQFSGQSRINPQNQEVYFVPFDYNPQDFWKSSISSYELQTIIGQIQAERQFAVLDTNFSSKGFEGIISRLERENKELEGLLKRDLWILGTTANSTALEVVREGKTYGLLSLSLIEGLSGKADSNNDGFVSVKELNDYSQIFVQKERTSQKHQLWNFGDDFILSKYEKPVGQSYCLPGFQFLPASFKSNQQDKTQEDKKEKSKVRAEIVGDSAKPLTRERKGKDYALLIATDNYQHWGHLDNPVNDAETIAKDLQEIYNFEINPAQDILRNPKKKDILDALKRIKARQYQPDDQLFIFFAGHGYFNDSLKEGYLIAADSNTPADDEFGESFLTHSILRKVVDSIDCKHILLIIDACFGGTFDEQVALRRGNPGYEDRTNMDFIFEKMQYKTRRYLTSGGKEYVPDGRPGFHSPFASKFIDALRGYGGKNGILTVNGILANVERARPSPLEGRFGSDEPGSDFIFVVKKKDVPDEKK